jgi:hypothetical protein
MMIKRKLPRTHPLLAKGYKSTPADKPSVIELQKSLCSRTRTGRPNKLLVSWLPFTRELSSLGI